jgi:hypothetical protein
MSIQRGIDGADPVRPQPLEQPAGPREIRRSGRTWLLGTGTLACPACDAPVVPAAEPMSPADALSCPVCFHAGAVRDFLSLVTPTRPARVDVRVVTPAMQPRRPAAPAATTRRP